MSGFSVSVREAKPHEHHADCTHEVTLLSPNGQKRWFSASSRDSAMTIAQHWAAFLGVEYIDLYFTPTPAITGVFNIRVVSDA